MPKTPLSAARCKEHLHRCLSGRGHPAGHPGLVGAELEAFAVCHPPGGEVTSLATRGADRFFKALAGAAAAAGGSALYGKTDPGIPLKVGFPDGDAFQFEPGGQVELVTAPAGSLGELRRRIRSKQEVLQSLERTSDYRFYSYGTHPWLGIQEIGMPVARPRYRALRAYLDALGPYGRMMMLQTCAIQLNLDLGPDPGTRVKRFVAANLLAPYATAIFAHSSFLANQPLRQASYRSHIWRQLDPSRTGVVPLQEVFRTLDEGVLADALLQFALQAPLVHVPELGPQALPAELTLARWIDRPIRGISPGIEHLENHLTLLFPEVRLKSGFMEVRGMDALPPPMHLVPATFYTSLLYCEGPLNRVLELLGPSLPVLPGLLEQAAYGLESAELAGNARKLMELAMDGHGALPPGFSGEEDLAELQEFYERYTARGRTPADDMRNKFQTGPVP